MNSGQLLGFSGCLLCHLVSLLCPFVSLLCPSCVPSVCPWCALGVLSVSLGGSVQPNSYIFKKAEKPKNGLMRPSRNKNAYGYKNNPFRSVGHS